MRGRRGIVYKISLERPEGLKPLEYVGVNGRIILNWILK
jgi:hypothetical protein